MTGQLSWPVILLATVAAFSFSAGGAWIMQRVARQFGMVDRVERSPERKRRPGRTPSDQAVPLLGGVAIYVSMVLVTAVLWQPLTDGYVLPKYIVGLWLAGAVLMLGGWLDDWKQLRPQQQILFPIVAVWLIIASGIGIDYITNPFGGVIRLQQWSWTVLWLGGLPYHLTLWADVFTLIWLLTSSYTTKILDGLDGLVPGVGIIGALIIALVSFRPEVGQPETGVLSIIFAAACAGFLVWNWSPARMYLGEGGSVFIGFMLGVLAIISGGKIATALLILGLPLVDLIWVVVRRWLIEHRSPLAGDTLHMHFQLQQLGWSDRRIVLLYYGLISVFGLSTVWLEGKAKVVALVCLVVLTVTILVWLYGQVQQHKRHH